MTIHATTRPADWRKVINQDSETCHWVAPDGSIHPGTVEENKEVAAQLLEMRVRGEAVNQKHSRERS